MFNACFKTGYGYIQAGQKINSLSFEVGKFVEKPNKATAEKFLAANNYFWNIGIFLFHAENYLKELKKLAPIMYKACMAIYFASNSGTSNFCVNKQVFRNV